MCNRRDGFRFLKGALKSLSKLCLSHGNQPSSWIGSSFPRLLMLPHPTCKARARVGFCEATGNSHMFRGEVSCGDCQVHVYLCPSLSPHTYVHTYSHTPMFTSMPTHLCSHLCPHTPMFIPMPPHTYVHTYHPTSMFTPIPTHTYVHTCLPLPTPVPWPHHSTPSSDFTQQWPIPP